MKQARRPPSSEHPLGYGKAVYFWSFLVAVMLFTVGGMFSLYEGIHKILHPEPIQKWWLAVGVLAFSIVAEAVSMRACVVEVNKARGRRSLQQWFRESRQAELVVIFAEDLAALSGLSLALVAVVLAVMTGNPLWDALGTIAIGLLLIGVAVLIAIEVKAMLIGQSADPQVTDGMKAFLKDRPEISRVLHLITLQLGDDLMVSAKVEVSGAQTAAELVGSINVVEKDFRARFPQVRWSFFEPDDQD